ncbi:MAG: DNA-binding protein [Polaromonas sp.]|nr:DNA-binding protein [Polaromonas sp.]
MILVDTNVLLDIYKADAQWMPWSLRQLHAGKKSTGLMTNMVVYAELAGHPGEPSNLDGFLDALGIRTQDISRAGAHLAGLAFRTYRQRGGTRTGVLPDFFIGAQAQVEGWPLLTRDAARYRAYFPGIQLICP